MMKSPNWPLNQIGEKRKLTYVDAFLSGFPYRQGPEKVVKSKVVGSVHPPNYIGTGLPGRDRSMLAQRPFQPTASGPKHQLLDDPPHPCSL